MTDWGREVNIETFLSEQMTNYVRSHFFNDFLLLDPLIENSKYPKFPSYLPSDMSSVFRHGDCSQLSYHFATSVLERNNINWGWLTSSDKIYDLSRAKNILPFRSTGIYAWDENSASKYFVGVSLGHTEPFQIGKKSKKKFWGKIYQIESLSDFDFKIHTIEGLKRRHRHYEFSSEINFQDIWSSLVQIKNHYSITTYIGQRRYFFGYNLVEDRVYFNLKSHRIRSLKLSSCINRFDSFKNQFSIQKFPSNLLDKLVWINENKELLNGLTYRFRND